MNSFLVAGALLAVAIGLAHSWLGEQYLLIRLFRRGNLPRLFGGDAFTKRTLRFAWHLTTLAWWGLALLLLLYAIEEPAPVRTAAVWTIALTFLASAALALVVTRGRHLSWIVFLAIAVTAWWGVR